MPLLQQSCETGFEEGKSATEILKKFFQDFTPGTNQSEQFDLLFNFIQYVERQVALFDSIEDSAFEQINDLTGRGTITSLLMQAKFENNKFNAIFTFAQKDALLALPDYAHVFQHPLATGRGISGIMVFVDKISVAGLTQYGPEIVNPTATTRYSDGTLLWYYGTINLLRIT